MSAIASPEFIASCHAQLRLLTQQMAESTAALYMAEMTETATDGEASSHFVPVVSYPEPVDSWLENFSPAPWEAPNRLQLALPVASASATWPELRPEPIAPTSAEAKPDSSKPDSSKPDSSKPDNPDSAESTSTKTQQPSEPTSQLDQQLVVPLIYTDVVVGLLVAIRRDIAPGKIESAAT